ncbi:MAG: hypothetical protein KA198_05495 [Chitinophagaceae bacterium]|nr:hypothetical protein [Chitinophagaceae bacterium]
MKIHAIAISENGAADFTINILKAHNSDKWIDIFIKQPGTGGRMCLAKIINTNPHRTTFSKTKDNDAKTGHIHELSEFDLFYSEYDNADSSLIIIYS